MSRGSAGEEVERSFSAELRLDDLTTGAERLLELAPEKSLYFAHARVAAELERDQRVGRDLNTLLRVSTAISSVGDAQDLQRRLLELCLDVTQARRAAVLLVARDGVSIRSTLSYAPGLTHAQDQGVSRTIVGRVLERRVAVLSNNVSEDSDIGDSPSVNPADTASVLCVPLLALKQLLGALYLDNNPGHGPFDERHLELVTAIAAMAAVALRSVERIQSLEDETTRLQSDLAASNDLIGQSPAMLKVQLLIARVAPHDTTVLIRGESGTGKEPVARAIHQLSARAEHRFIAINCAAVPDNLLESELFGYEKGAFTGATARKLGKFEAADGGTLFLDEIGELAPAVQAKLLRVLQEREIERLGATVPIKVDVRVIAATNRNLEDGIKRGTFREDLFYRLNVVSLRTPPLRERGDDILLLAEHFVARGAVQVGRRIVAISDAARTALRSHAWPGNVRELENAMERAVVLGNSDVIELDDLPETLLQPSNDSSTAPVGEFHQAVIAAKKQIILAAFDKVGDNVTEAAHLLGLHPNYLHRLLGSLDLRTVLGKAKPHG